jgi:phosphoribosylpyrophosphate synthetase
MLDAARGASAARITAVIPHFAYAHAIAHGQREWLLRFLEWTKAAGVKDPKATARALVVLFDGAVAGSEVDGPKRTSDARWLAKKLSAG